MMRQNRWLLVVLLFLLGGAISSLRAVAATMDEEKNEWEIRTVQDLYDFAEYVNAGKSVTSAKLMNDIVVNELVFKDNNYTLIDDAESLKKWIPLGQKTTDGVQHKANVGTFDGQGHTISGLYCDNGEDGTSFTGFFAWAEGCTIKNLGIINSYFRGYKSMGTFVGYAAYGNLHISNCWAIGNLLSAYFPNKDNARGLEIGGIVGYMASSGNTLNNCGFVGRLHNTDGNQLSKIWAGGIAGAITCTINNCYSSVELYLDYAKHNGQNENYFGRLIGNSGTHATAVPFNNCYATAVTGTDDKNKYMLCRYRTGVASSLELFQNPEGSVVETADFASGLVAYLLNGKESGKSDRWRQRIDGEDSQKDAYPVLSTTENNIVFAEMAECPDNKIVLSNSEVTPKTHSYQVDNAPSGKVSLPLYEMHCKNGGCGKEKPNTLVVKLWDGTDNLELEYALAEEKTDERELCAITINSENKHCVFKTATDDLTINSDKPYYSPVDFLVPGTLTFSRSFVPNTGCYTMFLPFKLTASEHVDLGSFYTCSGLKYKSDNNYNQDFNAISNSNDIAAHTGCLFLPKEANETVPGIIVTDKVVKASTGISNPNSTSGKTNYAMYGTYQLTDIPTYVFGYYEKDGKAVFALGGSGAKLKQFRAYLYLTNYASSAKEIPVLFFDEVATGVNEILARPLYDANSPVYDLFGRRVVNPQRGSIYIQNGMKFKM